MTGDEICAIPIPARRCCALRLVRWLTVFLFLSLVLAAACRADETESAPVGDAAGRAAFLLSFLGYIEWPSAAFALADEPYVIGVINNEAVLAELLLSATGRTVASRPVEVRALHEGDKPDGVHLLYIGPTPSERLAAILAGVSERWTVTVTDGDNGLALGSAINFRDIGARLRFEVSMPALKRADYRFSSRMLSVARLRREVP
ncbi:YfiR family protein [Noviherbaspirillum pedocola]|uniref:YfiR family protein n=1 Tax=Noviherbaspirillum pedocola TaxID=2801341 RepID=A0A934SUR6_9BURK|nr:YfiR family protein [Noviherbaspirillum pedocola]MBK4735663.1 YfiR family protein [Noviherbaspirillum pedocola]